MTKCNTIQPIPARAGVGLRHPHYRYVMDEKPDVPWFEIHSENFFAEGGMALYMLEQIRAYYPLSFHGVGLSLGSASPLDPTHLKKLKSLSDRFAPSLVSEHISWSQWGGIFMNDLLPIPYTHESLAVIVANIQQTQDYLGRQILVENPSSYLAFADSDIPEHEFIIEVARKSGCGLLLDVNNIYVSSRNNNFDPYEYLTYIPSDIVQEIHLAGHESKDVEGHSILIDTHSRLVAEPVWDVYKAAIAQFGRVPTLIEWDTDIPTFEVLLNEAVKAEEILELVKLEGDEFPLPSFTGEG